MAEPVVTGARDTLPRSIRYDGLQCFDFQPISLVINSTTASLYTNSYMVIPFNMKIFAVGAVFQSGAAGTATINVCLGTGAVAGVGTPDNTLKGVTPPTVAGAGNTLFSGNGPALTMTNALPQMFYVNQANTGIVNGYDVIWPAGGLLNLRSVTNGTGAGSLLITLAVKPVNIYPWAPYPANAPWVPSATTL